MNPLWAHLWLLWACGHFGLASSHAVHPAPRPGHRIITGAVDTRRARAGGAPTSLLKFAGGSQPSARVPGGSYKLPAEPGAPSGLWRGDWMKLLKCDQSPHMRSVAEKRTEGKLSLPGGRLLPATSEVPLSPLLNHLARNYSQRASRGEEPSLSPPAPAPWKCLSLFEDQADVAKPPSCGILIPTPARGAPAAAP